MNRLYRRSNPSVPTCCESLEHRLSCPRSSYMFWMARSLMWSTARNCVKCDRFWTPMIEELKKLKVFVSSVQNELEDERLIVQNLLNTDPFLWALAKILIVSASLKVC